MTKPDFLDCLQESGYAGSIDIDFSLRFSEVGIDSLDVFAWISSLESRFSISISDEQLQNLDTPQDLFDLVCTLST